MFNDAKLGIHKDAVGNLTVQLAGSRKELLVLASTLNAMLIKHIIDEPNEFSSVNSALQENTLKAFLGLLAEEASVDSEIQITE